MKMQNKYKRESRQNILTTICCPKSSAYTFCISKHCAVFTAIYYLLFRIRNKYVYVTWELIKISHTGFQYNVNYCTILCVYELVARVVLGAAFIVVILFVTVFTKLYDYYKYYTITNEDMFILCCILLTYR